jgi:hypothetical protein
MSGGGIGGVPRRAVAMTAMEENEVNGRPVGPRPSHNVRRR